MAFFSKIIKPVLDIKHGERLKTFLMFLYFFLTISLIYILKPAQKSLFLAEFGAKNLPYANIAEGLFLILVVNVYMALAKRIPRQRLYLSILLFFVSNLILFWFLLRTHMTGISAVFYVWYASFSITITTVFWSLANDLFKPEEAKRLFGVIISGGSAGGIFGGLLTGYVMKWLKTEDLTGVAALILILCVLSVVLIWRKIPDCPKDPVEARPEHSSESAFKIFRNSSYLVMLTGVVVLAKMSSTIVDNQFNAVVEQTIHGKEQVTAFFGWFYAVLNSVSFVSQLVLTSLALRFLGVGFSLALLPLGLLGFSVTSWLFPLLWVSLAYRMYDGSVNYSIQQASKEILYLPISGKIRARIKPVIDMLGFRGAKSLAGVYMALAGAWFGIESQHFGILVLCLIPFWLWVVVKMKGQYHVELAKFHLENGKD